MKLGSSAAARNLLARTYNYDCKICDWTEINTLFFHPARSASPNHHLKEQGRKQIAAG